MKTTLKTLAMMIFMMGAVMTTQAQTSKIPKAAQDDTKSANSTAPGTFVDKNNDGICDNFKSRPKNGQGKNFVDINGDGICDNRQNTGTKGANTNQGGRFCRQGKGNGNGNGNCCGRGNGNRNRFGGGTSSTDIVK